MQVRCFRPSFIGMETSLSLIRDKVDAGIPVCLLLMFHITDAHSNERDMHQYFPIIIPVEFNISPYRTSVCAWILELLQVF